MSRRPYRSTLREAQASQTRATILEAVIDLVNREGAAELSIRDLARHAGVAERTIYRYFPDRQALVDGVAAYVGERAGWGDVEDFAGTVHELVEMLPVSYASFDATERETRALVLLNRDPARTASISREHRAAFTRIVARSYPSLTEDEVAEVVAVLALLGSSRTWLRFRDEAGLAPGQAGRVAQRAARAFVADLDARTSRP